ncbi:MAG: Ig-like domain-containing protein [Pseudomonadota bacterium]
MNTIEKPFSLKNLLNTIVIFSLGIILSACGGGGGSPGANGQPTAVPSIAFGFVNAAGVSTHQMTTAAPLTLRVLVRDKDENPVPNTKVTFTTSDSLALMTPSVGTSLTDSNGIAKLGIRPSSSIVSGAGTVTASASVNGVAVTGSIDFSVAIISSPPASLRFTGADPTTKSIVIKGSGGLGRSETATLKFQVLDETSNPVAGQTVAFSVASAKPVTLNKTSAVTDGNGEVLTTVNSGTEATTFRVTASLSNGLSTLSDSISVTTGVPVQKAISISRVKANIEGWEYDDTPTTVNILLADVFGNPVADGTPVSFQTNIGAVGSSDQGSCNTLNGKCSVAFRSQLPRQVPSTNPNDPSTSCNTPTTAENTTIQRVGMATICAEASDGALSVHNETYIFLSGSFVRFANIGGSFKALGLSGVNVLGGQMNKTGSTSFNIQLNDLNHNPMPQGTTVALTNLHSVKALGVIPSTVQNVSPYITFDSVDKHRLVIGDQGSWHNVAIEADGKCEGKKGSEFSPPRTPADALFFAPEEGTFSVVVTTPFGNQSVLNFMIVIDCS